MPERPAPLAAAERLHPEVANDLEPAAIGLRGEHADELVLRAPLVEWRDQRLHEGDGALEGTRIPPAFEGVRRRNVPVAEHCRLVHLGGEIDAQIDLRQPLGEADVRRRSEDRIPPQDDEQPDLSGVDRPRQLGNRARTLRCGGLDARPIGHRGAGIAQRVVDGPGRRVHGFALILPGHHQRPTLVPLQVLRNRRHPPRDVGCARTRHARPLRGSARCGAPGAYGPCQFPRHVLDLGSRDRQAVVRLGAGQRGRALDRIEPVHLLVVVGDSPARGEVLRITHRARAAGQEVGVERDDHVSLLEVVEGPARRRLRAECGRAGDWIVLVPTGLRLVAKDACQHLGQRRGGDRRGEEVQARAALGLVGCQRLLHRSDEGGPSAYVSAEGHRLGAVRVVEAQNRGLRQGIGGPEACGMLRIAFNLGRPPHVALDQDRHGHTADRNRAGKVERPPGHQFFRLAHVGHELFGRLLRAGTDPGKRQGSAHELEEVPPARRVVPLGRLLWELAVQVLAELLGVGELAEAAPVQAPLGAGQA